MGIRRARAVVAGTVLVAMTLLGTALAPAGASTGSVGGGGGGYRPGAPGVGDDYFPNHGNGGYDVRHYLLKVAYDPATDRLTGVATISARATQNLSRFNLDFVGLTVRSIKVNGRSASWSRTGPRAHGHATARAEERPRVHHRGPLRRRADHPGDRDRPRLHPGGRVHPHRRRRDRGRPARGRRQLVPGQRPPDRQGVLHLRGHGPRRPRGGRQRPCCWAASARRHPHLALARARADGLLPGHGRHRPVRHPPLPDRRRAVDVRRPRPRPVHRGRRPGRPGLADLGGIADDSLARQDEILDFLEERFGRYPFSTGGGIVDDYDDLLVRAGDPDPAGLLRVLLHRRRPTATRWSCTSWPTSGSATAWPWPSGRHIWLNEGFARYAEWLWTEERGPGHGPGAVRRQLPRIPADDPFWSVVIGDPGPGASCSTGRVRPGRRWPSTRCGWRSATGTSSGSCAPGRPGRPAATGTIPQFIRAGRAGLGRAAGRPVPEWLFTGSKPVLEAAAAAQAKAVPSVGMETMRR